MSQVVLVRQLPTCASDHLGGDLPVDARHQGEIRPIPGRSGPVRARSISISMFRGRRREFDAMASAGPSRPASGPTAPRPGHCSQSPALGRHRLVQPRAARPGLHLQRQDAGRAGPGDIVFQLRSVAADEFVSLLDHHQPLPPPNIATVDGLFQHVAAGWRCGPRRWSARNRPPRPPSAASRSFSSACRRKNASSPKTTQTGRGGCFAGWAR